MTNLGRAKEAAAIANGTAVVVTHIAIGDGVTVPSGGETALYNEIARKAISGHGTVVGASNVAYFDIFLEAAEGPYTIREAGLIDQDGDLIAIARYDPPISKPIPSSGQTVEGTIRLEIAFSNIAAITIVVDPSFKVALQRINRLPWLPIVSMTTAAPPASPSVGDVYLIPTGASGAWSGQSGKIAEYTSAGWGIISPPDGHGVSLPDGRIFVRMGTTYVEKIALDAQSGKWSYVAVAGTANALTASLSPIPAALAPGMTVRLKMQSANTGSVTLNLNGLGAKSIVYDELDGELNGSDWKSGSIVTLTYDGSVWRLRASIGLFDKRYSRLTTPPQSDFYVIGATGNDANTGFAATPAEGFATLQGAIDAISSRYITTGTVTIHVSGGNYQGFRILPSYVQSWRLFGDVTTPANCKIKALTGAVASGRGCSVTGAIFEIAGFEFDTLYDNVVASTGAQVTVRDCIIKLPSSGVAALSANRGTMQLIGLIKITGNGPYFVSVSLGGSLVGGYSDGVTTQTLTLDGSAGPTFTACCLFVEMAGAARWFPSLVTVVPGAFGMRYQARYNGIIDVNGAGENFLPGNTAGVASTGGQYN